MSVEVCCFGLKFQINYVCWNKYCLTFLSTASFEFVYKHPFHVLTRITSKQFVTLAISPALFEITF